MNLVQETTTEAMTSINDNPPGVPRFTSVRGQFMLPYLWKLKQEIKGAKSFDPDFDIVKANKWLRDSKRAGIWKYKPPKRRRRIAVKSKKKAFIKFIMIHRLPFFIK